VASPEGSLPDDPFTADPFPDVLPAPWTAAQTAAWDVEHNAFRPEDAKAWQADKAAKEKRLRDLKTKGVSSMTPAEKDEALGLLLERSML